MKSISEYFEECLSRSESDPSFDPKDAFDAFPHWREELWRKWRSLEAMGMVGGGGGPIEPPVTPMEDWEPSGPLGGRYVCKELLGRGGMGRVYAGEDLLLGRDVAIKLVDLRGLDESWIQRTAREAEVHATLEHPNIAPLHDFGREGQDASYLVMKLVGGVTLSTLLRQREARDARAEKALAPNQVADILRALCDALSFAHSKGILHRDLKPSNVMVGSFGEVQLMDWGIARSRDLNEGVPTGNQSKDLTRTSSGMLVGTLSYMSPEQARGEVESMDERTDVFGLGALMHHLLVGEPPYRGRTPDELLLMAKEGRRSESSLNRAGRELGAICGQALMREPQLRYASIAEFRSDLDAFREMRPGSAWNDRPWHKAVKGIARHPGLTGLAAAVMIALLLGTFLILQRSQLEQEKDKAWYRNLQYAQQVINEVETRFIEGNRDDYDLAAKHMIAWLQVNRIDLNQPEQARRVLNDLKAKSADPEVQRSLDGVRLAAIRLTLWVLACMEPSLDPRTMGLTLENEGRSDEVRTKARRRSAELESLLPVLDSLNASLFDQPWHAVAWDLMFDQQVGLPDTENHARVTSLLGDVGLPTIADASWIARLRGSEGNQNIPELEQVWLQASGSGPLAKVISNIIRINVNYAFGQGRANSTTALRVMQRSESYARAALLANPNSAWSRLNHARALGEVADFNHLVAEEFKRIVERDEGTGSASADRLRELVSEHLYTGFDYRRRAAATLRHLAGPMGSLQGKTNLVQVLAQIVNDYRREYDDSTKKRVDKKGYNPAEVKPEIDTLLIDIGADMNHSTEWLMLQGVIYFRMGDSSALRFMEQALKREPGNASNKFQLAQHLYRRLLRTEDETDRAAGIKLIHELIALNPSDPRYITLERNLSGNR